MDHPIQHLFTPPLAAAPADDAPPLSDRLLHVLLGRMTGNISPAALTLAWLDWTMHLAQSPGKWQQLAGKGLRKQARLAQWLAHSLVERDAAPCITPLPQDRRFATDAWHHWPYNAIYQGFLLQQQWWHAATTGIAGVDPHHQQVVEFVARQLLDVVSPVNFMATNPEVAAATLREGGMNLLRGAQYFAEDCQRLFTGQPARGTDAFRPGQAVAATPGKVVYRNHLIELIQYAPVTASVHAEPVLIVPAWIMKYYILDLSPHNSLVRHLVGQGHTVFMVSWHNPGPADRDLTMDDYVRHGVLAAIDAAQAIVPQQPIDAVGYCLGGTLLSMAAAWLARRDHHPLHSLTLFAAQTDFTEAGELSLFIDHSQLNYLKDVMWGQGVLDGSQMAAAFQLLRSNDLIWSQLVNQYLLGQRPPMTDLMAWNADTTRMPARMHAQYLEQLFLNNDLFEGRYRVLGTPVSLADIALPMFVVATETDHVAPWHSVYKIHLLPRAELTFVLTSGGHNAGIVSEPGHPHRHYRLAHRAAGQAYTDPETWLARTAPTEGSWWPAWTDWLAAGATGTVTPPALGGPQRAAATLDDAPGRYVFER